MEPKFQTSFIPKTPITSSSVSLPSAPRSGSISLLASVATILFILSILTALGLFVYEKVLTSQIASLDQSLVAAQGAFDTDTIKQLITASNQIQAAKTLLDQHVAVSNMFAVLESNVLPAVQFTSFSFDNSTDGTVAVTLEGQAQSYATVAKQSAIFNALPYMNGQMFSSLDLTDKGVVTMKFMTNIDPSVLSYTKAVEALSNSGSNSTPTQ